ncbi:MAG: porin [Thermoanaerobaculia bacterium]|jgi:hypothetical protein|nr:porin [Thermoanaerobaculia bacterium]MBP9825203.1 porin [Thermoanaerobaculia bacterium]
MERSDHRNSHQRLPARAATVIFALVVLAQSAARGDETSGFKFEFDGYATLGVVHSDEDRADFLGSLILESGAGFSQSWSPEVDSRVGAQLTATFTPRLSALVQVLAEQQADGEYTPHVEWMNLKYQVTPDASVRIGRIVVPTFMVSDYRKVGYVNVWIRPPNEVYALVPLTANDGVDASYRLLAGGFAHTFQASVGQSDLELQDGGTAKARNSWGFTATTERGAWTGRLAYQRTDLYIDSYNTLFDIFRQFGPEGEAIADKYDADGGPFEFVGAGVQYDPIDWFVMAEVGNAHGHSAVGDRTAWYISGGYRWDRFTPYATYSAVSTRSSRSDPGLTVDAYPPPFAAIAAGLNAALNGLLRSSPDQNTTSIGVRWDFMKNLDLKLQFDHSDLGAGSAGNLGNVQPGFRPGGSYNLVSIAVDIVF